MVKVLMLGFFFAAVAFVPNHALAKSKKRPNGDSTLQAEGAPGASAQARVESEIREPLDDSPKILTEAQLNAEKNGVDDGANWHNIKMTKTEKAGLITLKFETQALGVLPTPMSTLAEIEMAKACKDNFQQEFFAMTPQKKRLMTTAMTKFRCVSATTKDSFSAEEHFKNLCADVTADNDPKIMLIRLCENRLEK